MQTEYIYQRLAAHYLAAIRAGTLGHGARMPSVRALMRQHGISLSTALQLCRHLEQAGWLEARPRSGYFVLRPAQNRLAPVPEPARAQRLDSAQYSGIHARVSDIVAQGQREGLLDMARASGTPDMYPAEQLRTIATRLLRRRPELLVSNLPQLGDPAFKAALAKYALSDGMQVAADDIVVTHGCIEALNLALRAVAQPGDVIAVESPTFYGLLQVLESLGLGALEIPTSPLTGLSVDALELALRTTPEIRAVVVSPRQQNPLGSNMPESHVRQLLDLCERHGVAVIEDDCYSTLADADVSGRSAKSLDTTGNVIYCASLHKILAPGMRLGWMAAGRWHNRVSMLKYAQTRFNDALSQAIAAEFIGSPAFERHLRHLRVTARARRTRRIEAVARYFPAGSHLTEPRGGFYLWVALPRPVSSRPLFQALLEENILISPGLMYSNSDRFDHCVRIGFGPADDAVAEAALRRVGVAAARLAGMAPDTSVA